MNTTISIKPTSSKLWVMVIILRIRRLEIRYISNPKEGCIEHKVSLNTRIRRWLIITWKYLKIHLLIIQRLKGWRRTKLETIRNHRSWQRFSKIGFNKETIQKLQSNQQHLTSCCIMRTMTQAYSCCRSTTRQCIYCKHMFHQATTR